MIHLLVGLLAGAVFGVQTLVALAAFVVLEALAYGALRGTPAGLAFLLTMQIALQVGYLAGICLRSLLERVGIAVAANPERRSN